MIGGTIENQRGEYFPALLDPRNATIDKCIVSDNGCSHVVRVCVQDPPNSAMSHAEDQLSIFVPLYGGSMTVLMAANQQDRTGQVCVCVCVCVCEREREIMAFS